MNIIQYNIKNLKFRLKNLLLGKSEETLGGQLFWLALCLFQLVILVDSIIS